MQTFARFVFIALLIIVFAAVSSGVAYADGLLPGVPNFEPSAKKQTIRVFEFVTRNAWLGVLLPLVKFFGLAVCAGFGLLLAGVLFGYIGRLLGLRGRNLRRFEAGASRAFLRGRNVSKGKSGIPYVEDFGGKSYEIRFDK